MKRFVYTVAGLFFVSLGVVVGVRMSADAMAVIIGIAFGMVATIPTTLLLIYTLRQRDKEQMHNRQQATQYPPVVVVNAPPNGSGYHTAPPGQALLPPAGERAFKVVGQEATPAETLSEVFNLNAIWDDGD
ncbi:MAG: hypothetical protein D6796_03915 [Caldilineae bacterium]|nr:MAG: hypothetical protein D6796_03915 [Caldilineae bacterium]